MQLKQKYIITKTGRVIVFSELLQHKDFKHFEPIRAGFVTFMIEKVEGYFRVKCNAYGESISLGLKSDEVEDTRLIKKEILGYTPWDFDAPQN